MFTSSGLRSHFSSAIFIDQQKKKLKKNAVWFFLLWFCSKYNWTTSGDDGLQLYDEIACVLYEQKHLQNWAWLIAKRHPTEIKAIDGFVQRSLQWQTRWQARHKTNPTITIHGPRRKVKYSIYTVESIFDVEQRNDPKKSYEQTHWLATTLLRLGMRNRGRKKEMTQRMYSIWFSLYCQAYAIVSVRWKT